MDAFDEAIKTVLQHEGLFVNDPNDPGGATKYGISLRWLKQYGELQPEILEQCDLDHDNDVDADDIKNMPQELAINLYRTHWWDKYRYDLINDPHIAAKVFDLSINMGSKSAHRCLQRALRATTGEQLTEDGIIGSKTLALINQANPSVLLAALRSEAAGYYRSLNKPRYENGWLKRAYA